MDTSFISSAGRLSLAPAKMAGRVAGSLLRKVRGGRSGAAPSSQRSASAAPAAKPATRARPKARAKPKPRPKPLDDVTIARKVETIIFRGAKVDKGKVDVNVAEGVVWLRGEVRTPDLVKQLEARAAEVVEVRGVENLLHLPKTPAPSRTDTPAAQRKTRRSSGRPEERTVKLAETGEEAPAPASAEPSPKEVSAGGTGRHPAPLGSPAAEESAVETAAKPGAEPAEEEGPDAGDLDKDPAYEPSDPAQRELKGS